MWLWPLLKFYRYSPHGFVLAVAWNICELLKIKMPFSGLAFGIICGCKSNKLKGGGVMDFEKKI